jgi:hypothetical protein
MLTGCAARQLPSTSLSTAHKIGVISGLDDDILFARSGITVFGNAASRGSIAEWKIDELVATHVQTDLSPSHDVVTRVVSRSQIRAMAPELSFLSQDKYTEALRDILRSTAEHADLWIVVTPKCAAAGDYSGPVPCGISVSRPESFLSAPYAWITLQGRITVFDGATLKPIAQSDILLDRECSNFANNDMFDVGRNGCEPGIKLGHDYAVGSWQDYTDDQRNLIHQQLLLFLEPSLDFTLRRLKLLS